MSAAKALVTNASAKMKLFSDYHMHPQGHRVQPYTQELLQPWVDHARAIGLSDIAFTDHDRYHAGIDFDEIEKLRAKNPDMKIRAGIELDNDPETSAAGRTLGGKELGQTRFRPRLGSLPRPPGSDVRQRAGRRRAICRSRHRSKSTLIIFAAFARWRRPAWSIACRIST